jgi:hypothetical protein
MTIEVEHSKEHKEAIERHAEKLGFFERRYLPRHDKDLTFFDKVKIVIFGSDINYMLRDAYVETMIYMREINTQRRPSE